MGADLPPEMVVSNGNPPKLVPDDVPQDPLSDGAIADDAAGSHDSDFQSSDERSSKKSDFEIEIATNIGDSEELDQTAETVSEESAGGPSPAEASSVWPEAAPPPTAVVAPAVPTQSFYYLVKVPRVVENRSEYKVTEMQLKDKTEKMSFLMAAIQMKRGARQEVIEKLKDARTRHKACRDAQVAIQAEMKPLQEALNKFNDCERAARENNFCRSEAELNAKIAALEGKIQHESLSLREEKMILRDIQQLRASREQVCANEMLYNEVQSFQKREEAQELLRPKFKEYKNIKSRADTVWSEIAALEAKLSVCDEEVEDLRRQKEAAEYVREGVFAERRALSSQENAKNSEFFQNRRDIQSARQLAFDKKKDLLEAFCATQVERLMGLYNTDKSFRSDYVKNNERSTLRRLGTFDGRSLGIDEEPPVLASDVDDVTLVKPSTVSTNAKSKLTNKPPAAAASTVSQKPPSSSSAPAAAAVPAAAAAAATNIPSAAENILPAEDAAEKAREEAERRELRRQEEIAKAKEAEIRKKRQADRNQAKAEARAEKEAARKEKEKEKKMRKKMAANAGDGGAEAIGEADGERNDSSAGKESGKESEKESSVTRDTSNRYERSGNKNSSSRGVRGFSTSARASKISLRRSSKSFQQRMLENWQLIGACAAGGLFAVLAIFVAMYARG